MKQVEFYFSDSNLPNDKFLNEELKKNDGWVKIATLATFARLKALSTEASVIAAALRGSKELLEVNEDGTLVRRKTELADGVDLSNNNIYMKGFGNDATLDEIEAFLLNEKLNVKCVRMRYYKDGEERKFKGSVFVELGSEEEAKEAVTREYTYGSENKKLLVMSKNDYLESKKNEKGGKKRAREEDGKSAEEGEKKLEFTADLLVRVSDLGEGATREVIKGWFEDKAKASVAFIDFRVGDVEGVVRLNEDTATKATEAAKVLSAADADIKVGDKVPTFTALSGEAETAAWKDIEAAKADRRKLGDSKRGGRGGRGGGRGGKRSRN